jgi:hypothetical protein
MAPANFLLKFLYGPTDLQKEISKKGSKAWKSIVKENISETLMAFEICSKESYLTSNISRSLIFKKPLNCTFIILIVIL